MNREIMNGEIMNGEGYLKGREGEKTGRKD